jgi:glycosyltransferase involved in cell wall biosynthesis
LREPLVQTQVLPYLRELRRGGVSVALLTFEPGWPQSWPSQELREWQARLQAAGIEWRALAYHKRPSLLATLYDIAVGALEARKLVRRWQIDVLHARSYVPAAMGALAKIGSDAKLLFDIRGLLAEEYVDAGVWPAGGLLFRLTKTAERALLAAADGFVVLTEKARQLLFPPNSAQGRPLEVIPCCVDEARFRQFDVIARDEVRRELGVEGMRVFVYVGALDGWYLTDELAEFLATAHAEDERAFSLMLTQSAPASLAARLQALGVQPERFLIRQASPDEIPRYLKAADVALSFIKPCYSKLASSPTKIAEYLASGLPIISNAGIGDLDELLQRERVGVLLADFNRAAYRKALREAEALLNEAETPERCRAAAARHFDLALVGGARYLRLYQRMLGRRLEQAAQTAITVCR